MEILESITQNKSNINYGCSRIQFPIQCQQCFLRQNKTKLANPPTICEPSAINRRLALLQTIHKNDRPIIANDLKSP